MAGSQIAGSTPGWVCADDSQWWQGLDPDMDLDLDPEPDPSECHGWPVLMGWACGQTPCLYSLTWGYGSKQVTKYFCCGFPSSCLFTKCFQQCVKRYRWAQPCRIAKTTHNLWASEYWAGMARQQKPPKTALSHTQPAEFPYLLTCIRDTQSFCLVWTLNIFCANPIC